MRKDLIIALLLTVSTAGAVKMKPGTTCIRQSDGTMITVKAFGDENLSYFIADDGTLLYQQGTDFYIAKITADGRLASSNILAHDSNCRTALEAEAAKAQDKSLFYSSVDKQAKINRIMREPVADDNTLLPHTGKQKIPVILVSFSDTPFSVANPYATFNKYLNGKELFNKTDDPEMGYFTNNGTFIGNYGSVARYFNDMSFGNFQPEFDVYGPVSLNNPLSYYGAGSSSQEKMDELFSDACSAIDTQVDFSQYDSNKDGNVDLVYIIYAGYSQSIAGNSTDCIYPKSGLLKLDREFDGVRLRRYGVNNELNGTKSSEQKNGIRINGIGLFCHEFSHCMGLPDLYAQSGSTAEKLINQNMDYWSLMDAGEYTYNGYRPTAYTAWEREALGWMNIETLTGADDIEMKTIDDGGKAYRIVNDKDNSGNEYYLLQNVQKKGWNANLFGSGMMITHVDYAPNMFSLGGCKVNSTVGHPRMTLMAADGMLIPEYYLGKDITKTDDETVNQINADFITKYDGQQFNSSIYKEEAAGDLYPGKMQITSLTDTSAPMKAWTYTGNTMEKPITDISENTETGTISFKFMGGKIDGITSVTASTERKDRIFSISGIYMGNDICTLPKGLYIRNGKIIVNE